MKQIPNFKRNVGKVFPTKALGFFCRAGLFLLLAHPVQLLAAPLVFSDEVLLILDSKRSSLAAERGHAAAAPVKRVNGEIIHFTRQPAAGIGFERKRNIAQFDSAKFEEICQEARVNSGFAVDTTSCEPNFVLTPASVPNDPYNNLVYANEKIDLYGAWALSTGDSNVTVAIIDSGIELTHPDLRDNLWRNSGEVPDNGLDDDGNGFVDDAHGADVNNFAAKPIDELGHGTHVAGIVGARGNNSLGIAGINWNVSLMAVKFIDRDGVGSTAGAIQAIDYAVEKGARIINASWGSLGAESRALEAAIARARDAGVLFVAAAGNDAKDTDATPFYPASYQLSNIISVGASDENDQVAAFSNFGQHTVDLMAPGDKIVSTYTGGNYVYLSGTSMAAPHVAGVAALILAARPDLAAADLKRIILSSSDENPAFGGAAYSSARLNAQRAMTAAIQDSASVGAQLPWSMNLEIRKAKKGPLRFTLRARGDSRYVGETASLSLLIGSLTCTLAEFEVSDVEFALQGKLPRNIKNDVNFILGAYGDQDLKTSIPTATSSNRKLVMKSNARGRALSPAAICSAVRGSIT